MKIQRLAIALTMVNLVLLVFLLAQIRPATAQGVAPVLRGQSLEIVDDHGNVRAFLGVLPAKATTVLPNGKTFPETVILRLMDPKTGRPSVKINTSEQGSGLSLAGQSGTRETYLSLNADGTTSSLRAKNEDGRQQLIRP
jgi:hypothetical protein